MEKEKQTAKPQEVECPRPELYHLWQVEITNGVETGRKVSDGIQMRKGNGSVIVRADSRPLFTGVEFEPLPVGHHFSTPPTAPKYTGPIDDETMANILIYG